MELFKTGEHRNFLALTFYNLFRDTGNFFVMVTGLKFDVRKLQLKCEGVGMVQLMSIRYYY